MDWHYVSPAGKQEGPANEAALAALLKEGKITLKTYVWAAGEPGWDAIENKAALKKRLQSSGSPAAAPPPPPPMPPPAPAAATGGATESKGPSAPAPSAPKPSAPKPARAPAKKAGAGAEESKEAKPKKKKVVEVPDMLKKSKWSAFHTADG